MTRAKEQRIDLIIKEGDAGVREKSSGAGGRHLLGSITNSIHQHTTAHRTHLQFPLPQNSHNLGTGD